ncbi:MAG: sensor histidine kinase [Clostridia bacterium]|nr:sensor histidine kinase [Clostridia bacterium]
MSRISRNSRKNKPQKTDFRAYFLRLFDKYDLRNERQFHYFWKCLIFIALVIVEITLVLGHLYKFGFDNRFVLLLCFGGALLLVDGGKLFLAPRGKLRVALYAIEAVFACSFTFVTDSGAAMFIYVLVLTELYFSAERTKPSIILFAVAVPLYVGTYLIQNYVLFSSNKELLPLLTDLISAVFTLILHFVVVQVGLAFYRQFLRLERALKELDESQKELQKAYAVVAEVTALEERQRIAKEIHDTAGHSITTVIMQTEAAKLIIEGNPEEAKNKIVAANLQAKHALEELRDSVHLLSGGRENETLKTALENIIHESTDGTGITVRSEIEELVVSPAKHRFLCNSLKEGISNGLRHGNATAFWFELKAYGDKLRFLLSDNGKGVEKDWSLGFGLTGMSDRAKSLGGEVRFAVDEGFELIIELPLDKR